MLIRWTDLGAGEPEICIVGGGAAGLTLAHALSGKGLSILLLEAGGRKPTRAGQARYEGELVDPTSHPWLHHFRVRALGGSSRIWGGRCLPFDPIDFEARTWIDGPGWPFGLQTLTPYYIQAQDAAEAGAFDYDPRTALPGAQVELAPGLDGESFQTRLERFSKPTNLWTRYGPALEAAPDVRMLLDAPVEEIRLGETGRVDHLLVRRPDGQKTPVRARRYVLALGGLETVRLLLSSHREQGGVGGRSGHLGRHYMSHLSATAGQVRFARPREIAFDYERDAEGIYVRRRLALTDAAQRRLKGLNIAFRTHLPDPQDPAHGDPILSAMYLVKNFILYEYGRRMQDGRRSAGHQARHLANIVGQPARLARFATNWVRLRNLAERKMPSVVLGSPSGVYALEFHAEQAPSADSRVTLSDQRDAYGMPRLKVDWRMAPEDEGRLLSAYALLAEELQRTGVGQLDYDPEDVLTRTRRAGAYGGHHLGAARMSIAPSDGVVDPDCRVHGVENLFLVSGAVFPTSGQANPTLTILALAFRLAEFLAKDLANT